ncbi:transposase [Clostridium thermosuccinogenes]|jgi:putative transposase|uniref:Transposase n=1 Tax=Clostridium thermosuccinogenes TaxID=84032 RepID=A0A2K2F9N9_9CLOT|nr:transposase [Pseudoclostridium thermosuccinogenes]AUS95635.1 transposase [Pseudoclostridium thermosuccinogenes]PNT95512.1 transposase [Pseudoclostridium thermosuccinogenes]PNT96655.1 transposase [Pseudoclostridium thermosuccinogenes]
MDTQKVTSEYRLSQWAQVIQARLDSGQSVKDFCLANGISRNSYFYWQKKLREAACKELSKTEEPRNIVPSGWMQLTPKQAQHTKESLNIEINGCHITVNDDTDPELLKKVCRVLRTL